MSIFFTILALAACLSLTACSDEDEKVRLLEGIVKRSALNDSLKKEIIQSEIDKAELEAISDSLSKFGDLLLAKNNQLHKEVETIRQEADKSRRDNEHLQEEISQLQVDKRIREREVRRLAVEIDSISVDRDRLIGANQDLTSRLDEIKEVLAEVRRIQKSVRLLVGTESLLKGNRFLKTSRGWTLRKQYKLVKKLESGDSRVKIVPINQGLPLTLYSIPKALVGRSGRLTLQALIDRHGKLKKGRDYTVRKNGNTTIITFINRVLEGTDVLAVVEVED